MVNTGTSVMFLLPISLGLICALNNRALSLPVKGIEKGEHAPVGQWVQPKDWDWSVTTGRLIPVSEATDDVPTPGYRMSDLKQKIPTDRSMLKEAQVSLANPLPLNDTQEVNTGNNLEANIATHGQEIGPTSSTTEQQGSSTQPQTTQPMYDSTSLKPSHETTSQINEQKIDQEIENLPKLKEEEEKDQDTDKVKGQEEEKVPVIEETVKKVILPQLCSISGLGCNDKKTSTTHDSIEDTNTEGHEHKNTFDSNIFSYPSTIETTNVSSTEVTSTHKVDYSVSQAIEEQNQQTEKIFTIFPISSSTNVISSDSTQKNNITSSSTSDENQSSTTLSSNYDIQKSEHEENITPVNTNNISDVQVTEKQSEEAQVQKVDSFESFEQHSLEENKSTEHRHGHTEPTEIEDQKPLPSNLEPYQKPTEDNTESKEVNGSEEHVHQTVFNPLLEHIQKQIHADNYEDKSSNVQESITNEDIQKTLNPNLFEVQRRIDEVEEGVKIEQNSTTSNESQQVSNGTLSSQNSTLQVTEKSQNLTEEEDKLMKSEYIEHTSSTEHPTDQLTESPSFADRISNYWKAATGYVSKALNI